MKAAVTPSVFMHRTKHCGILHAELPWWCEAEMEVHRGKAARLDRMILALPTLGIPRPGQSIRSGHQRSYMKGRKHRKMLSSCHAEWH